MCKKVIILQGVSGSGKSTWARNFTGNNLIVSADLFMLNDKNEYEFDPNKLQDCHSKCFRTFCALIGEDLDNIIVDNTNCAFWEMKRYIAVARGLDIPCEIVSFDINLKQAFERNRHGVPQDVISKQYMKMRKDWDKKPEDVSRIVILSEKENDV